MICSQKAGEGGSAQQRGIGGERDGEGGREREDVCIREIANRVVGKRLITAIAAQQRQKN